MISKTLNIEANSFVGEIYTPKSTVDASIMSSITSMSYMTSEGGHACVLCCAC